jgi:hypothetical protein
MRPRNRSILERLTARSSSLAAILFAACGTEPAGPEEEVVTSSFETSASFSGLSFPTVRLTITGSGTSSLGHPVSVASMTLDGAPVTSPVLTVEGSHAVCVTVTSSSTVSATTCRTVGLPWPRFQGRAVLAGPYGSVTPPGLSLTVDDTDVFPIASHDGSFSIPSVRAASGNAKLWFTAAGGAGPSLVRSNAAGTLNVVMLPSQITIPSCSVYGGQVVALDLEQAFASAPGQSSYFDRINTVPSVGKVVVASWNQASILVALSDTGGPAKHFSPDDIAEVTAALSSLTSHFCQEFHLAPVSVARTIGVVVHKDPNFVALGAHSMAVPPSRGDYASANVVIRTIGGIDPAVRDSSRRTILHEFVHVLGFGHTCSWSSVMTTGTVCKEARYSLVPSPEDVAYYFAMRYAREAERALQTLFSVGPAYVGAMVAKGHAEVPIVPYFNQP